MNMLINEISTNRLLKHFNDTNTTLAVISTYRSERNEVQNRKLLQQFKCEVRKLGFGFTEFVSKWVEVDPDTNESISSDERSLAVYGISRESAIDFGRKYQQSSILFKDDKKNEVVELCTTPFVDYDGNKWNEGDIVRKFNMSSTNPFNLNDVEEIFAGRKGGPASKPVKSKRAFRLLNEMYEVELNKPTTFSDMERWIRIGLLYLVTTIGVLNYSYASGTTYRDAQGRVQMTQHTDSSGRTTYRDSLGRIQGTSKTTTIGRTEYRDSLGRLQMTSQTDKSGRTTYRDSLGRIQGTSSTDKSGRTTYRDAQGRIQGTKTTDKSGNSTYRDAQGRITHTRK